MRKEWSLKKLIAISISLTIICIALIYTGLIYMTIHAASTNLDSQTIQRCLGFLFKSYSYRKLLSNNV